MSNDSRGNETAADDMAQPNVSPMALPDTDDPEVLRELLRQAYEQLRHFAEFDKVMAENAARSQALLVEASRTRQRSLADPKSAAALESLRAHLAGAIHDLDKLQRPGAPAIPKHGDPVLDDTSAEFSGPQASPPAAITEPDQRQTVRTDLLIHNIDSPALARSAQSYLAGQPGVARAEVRELAEGLLRITVSSQEAVTASALEGWEASRRRETLTELPGVLEVRLNEAD